jgi:hypothetical protein
MPHARFRLYSGSGDRSPEELSKAVMQELVPELQKSCDLIRYYTIIADDGRIGSGSMYQSKEGAEQGARLAREWAERTKLMQGYNEVLSLESEVVRILDGDSVGQRPMCGSMRILETPISAEQLADTVATRPTGAQGRIRTVVFKLPDNRVLLTAAFASREAMENHAKMLDARRDQPPFSEWKVVEEIKARIVDVSDA